MLSAANPLDALLLEQCGIITREQLRVLGISKARTLAQIDGGRWRALNDQIICTHNATLTTGQARWAVALGASGLVALCGLTVMELAGVKGFTTPTVHALVPQGGRVLGLPEISVRVHQSRRFGQADVLSRQSLPVTSLDRAIIDAAAWSRDALTAARIVVAPVQQRLTRPARLSDQLIQAGQIRHRSVLRPFLADLEGGAEALSEVAFLRWCRRHGFPRPTMNVRKDASGRRRYLDARFCRADGRAVLAEIDGGVHLNLATRWLDTAKDNDDVIAGNLVLRFPSIAIYLDDHVAVAQLRAALGA